LGNPIPVTGVIRHQPEALRFQPFFERRSLGKTSALATKGDQFLMLAVTTYYA